jgi:hypothetical protein
MFAADHSLFTSQADRDVRADHVPRHETSFPLPRHAGACSQCGDAGPAHRRMSMPKPARPNMATVTPLGPLWGPDGAEAGRRGGSSWARNHPPLESVFLRRGTEGLCLGTASLHSGHLRGIGATNREPGRILIPGDGAAGDQGAQHRPACPAMAAMRRLRAIPSPTSSWRYGLRARLASCSRQVTSTSVHRARPGPASAPRGHAPLYAATLSLARAISDRLIHG